MQRALVKLLRTTDQECFTSRISKQLGQFKLESICSNFTISRYTGDPRLAQGIGNSLAVHARHATPQFPASYRSFTHVRQYNTFRQSYVLRSFSAPSSSCENALRVLVGLNVAAFLGWKIDPAFMMKHFLVSLQHIRSGYVHTLITSCFSHKDGMHLLANMFTLYFFWNRGFPGRLVYFLYLCGGVAGNVAYLAQEYYKITSSIKHPRGREIAIRHSPPALGASGSVNACVTFNILVSPQSTVLLYGIIPVPAFLFGGLWIYSDIIGATGGQQSPGPGGNFVGHTAHLGGALVGALTYFAYRRGRLRF